MVSSQTIKLIPDPNQALVFKVVDADTGRELTPEEVEARRPREAGLPLDSLPNAAKTKGLTAVPLRICGEGDSWMSFLQLDLLFPKTFFDILGETFSTRNLGFPGHTFERIVSDNLFVQNLASGNFKVFIFSGGGNDFLGGGGLARLLKNKSDGNGSAAAADYIDAVKLADTLGKLKKGYRKVAKQAKAAHSDLLMLTHGYDYAIPVQNGQWLGNPLKAAGFAHDDPLSRKIIIFLVDRFNDMLGGIDSEFAHVRHVNVRKTIKTLWRDELHPTTAGARKVAKLFEAEINKLLIS